MQQNFGKNTKMKLRNFEENFSKYLSDPDFAKDYLESAFEEDGIQGFLTALQNIVRASEGMTKIADKVNVGRESLYKSLSDTGNPQIRTVESVLNVLGLRISVAPLKG